MDIDRRWGLSLVVLTFLITTRVHCQNQTTPHNTTATISQSNTTASKMEDMVPGTLKVSSGNIFEAPDIFGGQPFSLKTDPVTGKVDFQTRTVDVQTVTAARDQEEAQKRAELHEDIRSRIPSEDLPLEARDEEYVDDWGQPIRRSDVEYYEDEEPEMTPPRGFTPTPATTPKEEDSFMSIFESLFGGGGEEEKKAEDTKPTSTPYRPTTLPTTSLFTTTEYTTTTRPTTTTTRYTTTRRTTERQNVYQQFPERQYQPPNRYPNQQQSYYPKLNRVQERPVAVAQPTPVARPDVSLYEKPNLPPQRPATWQERPITDKPAAIVVTTESVRNPVEKPVNQQRYPERQPLKEPIQGSNDWHSVQSNKEDHNDNQLYKKQNIDRQDTVQNEVKPVNSHTPDYYNFINLPVHYSTKDTAIPLISTSYANTKIQGMGASKYDKNNSGKYSNHKYDAPSTTSKRPSYWSTRSPSTTRPSPGGPIDFDKLEYDESAIGLSADFGGYGNKAGVNVQTETPTTTTTQTRTTPMRTTPSTTTTTKVTPIRTTPTQPAPVREYEEYDYDSYPAHVKPVANPISTMKPTATTTTTTTTTSTSTTTARPQTSTKETEYEYYDYDTEQPITTTQKYKIRYPSLPKDRIKQTEEKVAVVIPTKIETTMAPSTTTTTTTTSTTTPSTTPVQYYPRPQKEPAPVSEDNNQEQSRPVLFQTAPPEEVKPIIVTAGKKEENANIVLVPAKSGMGEEVSSATSRRPDFSRPSKYPGSDYTTEFTVGAVHGHPGQGHFISSSIVASPFDDADGPFRPIPRPPGMSASFQVTGDDADLKEQPPKAPTPFQQLPQESDVHEEHEFIPSPQFHRPDPNHFIVGTSFNTKPAPPPFKKQEYFLPPPPPKNEVGVKQKPQRPGFFTPPPTESSDLEFSTHKKPQTPQFGPKPVIDEEFYKPTNKPNYYTPKPNRPEDDFGFFDKRPTTNKQTNIELSVDYDFDGIQTQPKPGEYVIFPKPQLNPEMNENQIKKVHHSPLPHFHDKTTTMEIPKPSPTTTEQAPPPQEKPELEKQQEVASTYPRPHWEKNGKPSFLLNNQLPRQPLLPPQMSQNLIPPSNMPPRFRKPVTPSNLPPIRKNFNEVNFQSKPKPNLPNILPQFRPNAKIPNNGHRPYRHHPNRRQENFPYRIQSEPDTLMHRDFEVDEELVPKFINNRVKIPEFEQMLEKRLGEAPPAVPQRRIQRTPVTTLQMLQQNHGIKKQQMPMTREDQPDSSVPLVPPAYKPYKDDKKDVFLVYPMKTPFNGNIKIEDPDKIEYNYNQTVNQVPLLKPSKKKEKLKPEFPYGFVTPEERPKEQRKEVKTPEVRPNLQDYMPTGPKGPQEGVRPNIQDYMPSGAKVPIEKQERIDMNLHMQSNNQWNQVSTYEEPTVIIGKDESIPNNPPTQYHTLLKNINASEFTLGAVMHTLPEKSRQGQVTSVSLNEGKPSLIRPGLNVNERIANGKIVTVSMPLDVKEEKSESTGFQAPFQASSSAQQSNQGWNFVKAGSNEEISEESTTEANATTFNFENFKPELIGGFKPIYNTPDPEVEEPLERDRTVN